MNLNTSPHIDQAMQIGFNLASQKNHEYLTLEHFVWGILHLPVTMDMFTKMNVNIAKLRDEFGAELNKSNNTLIGDAHAMPRITMAFERVLSRAAKETIAENRDTIPIWSVILKMMEEKDSMSVYLLEKNNVNANAIKAYATNGKVVSTPPGTQDESGVDNSDPSNQKESSLASFAINLNERAKENKIDSLIGRDYEIQRTAQILSRRRKNNPLLVGEPGVGKTAIAEGLAKMIADGSAPEALDGKQIWSLNMGALLAGTKFRGDFEQRIKNVLDEVKKDPDIVLFIDEIHTLIGAGASGGNSMDASNIIKPALSSGDLRVIGATTFQEYRELFEKEKALDRRFQKIDVSEPSPSETVDILKGLKKSLEKHHGVKYTAAALQGAVDLSVKYIPDRFLPDKAIDILDEAGAAERSMPVDKRHAFIDQKLIEETISRITKIPISQVTKSEKVNLKNLEKNLRSTIFGQDEAISKLSESVCISKAGLNDENKPLGSFMFAGPTGVGKTEVVKQLSKNLDIELLRFDMSEYMEAHSVSRLVGSPPGYVGHDKGGLLTDAVFKNPHSIILLDEIEKAHPDVLNILLQVLDHGSLTDSNGRKVNFKNSFIVMTTNAGAQVAQKASMGFVKADHSTDASAELNKSFSPEFRNRIDSILTFNSLGQEEIIKIVDKNILLLEKSLKGKKVTLDVSDDVKAKFAKEGFDPLMGARPMARLIQEKLKKPLATQLLFGSLSKGGVASIQLDDNGDLKWTFSSLKPKKSAKKAVKKSPKKSMA